MILLIYSEINKASVLQNNDFVGLVASFHSQSNTEVDYISKGYTPQQIQAMQIAANKTHKPVEYLGLSFTKPLSNFKIHNFDYIATLYNQYDKHGTLPFPGCLTEQPNKVIEAFNVIKALILEESERQQKQQKQKR